MIVVADSSALIALAVCDALSLLVSVTDEIVVPPAVFDEVVVEGRRHSDELRTFLKGRVESVDASELESRTSGLGQGELEAIALCLQKKGALMLVDDQRARKAASECGLSISGSLGVLLMAKRRGLLPTIRPSLDRLRASDIHLSDELSREILAMAGEG